jgi:hypothetical protein
MTSENAGTTVAAANAAMKRLAYALKAAGTVCRICAARNSPGIGVEVAERPLTEH